MIKYDFNNQTAIITGGTRGIGAAVSSAFLQAGAEIIAIYSGNDTAAQAFVEANNQYADKIKTVKCDVRNYEDCEAFFHNFETEYKKLDILVNCAGIRKDSVVAMMPKESWQSVLDVNLTGCYNMSKLSVLQMMKERYGRIISMTSPIGRMGFAGQANYAASKAGLVALCKSLSKEVARRKITVNCVSPGFIDTDFILNLSDEQKKEYTKSVPIRRFGTAAEVANAVLFLASQESNYITGSVLEVTGGI
ncbi:MAG: 3-oxoacyl-ACP reductase FabG [Lentisphaeria bacterium]